MAWQAPPTFVDNEALSASQLNILSANLNETEAGIATTAGRFPMTAGKGRLAERELLDAIVETSEQTSSTSYEDLDTPGPEVTITCGPKAIVDVTCQLTNSSAGVAALATFQVLDADGSEVIEPQDFRSLTFRPGSAGYVLRATVTTLIAVPEPDADYTFRMVYRVSGGTGTFARRRINVQAL